MAKAAERDLSRIGWLDYVLTAIGSCLAVFSAGMSIQEPVIGYFSVALVIIGTLTSYVVRIQTLNSPVIKWDGFIYSAAVICSIYFSSSLAGLMPDGGYPREMAAAGWLSWMMILGSFAIWQDSTLLFQAIPSLALFGLVGCYDTYKPVTFNFFAFLICLATLFARAHGRQMLRQAAQSGYFTRGLAPGTPIPSVETTPGLAMELKKGPWRWVAGPEWALLSALGVVLLSLLGAPILQQTVAPIAGLVTLPPPSIRNQPQSSSSSNSNQTEGSVRIGRGPNTHASPLPVFEAKLDKKRYLREQTYLNYSGRAWQNPPLSASGFQDQETPTDVAIREMTTVTNFEFEVTLLQAVKYVPLPPEVIMVSADHGAGALTTFDGTVQIGFVTPNDTKVSGRSWEPAPQVRARDAVRGGAPTKLVDVSNIPPRVTKLALEVTKGCKTDYERAEKIDDEIAKRIVYNLAAEPTPGDQDPVEYALFVSHEAYCDIYASAMVLMARAVGIPARYVQGYLPDDRRLEKPGSYILTNQDYHAWAELMFKDVGWMIFDPTLKARSVEGEGLGDQGKRSSWFGQSPLMLTADVLVVFAAIALALYGGRYIKERRRLVNARSEVERSYLRFGRRLERVGGHRRNIGQTADEFLESVRPGLGDTYSIARDLNEQFMVLLYSSDTVASEAVVKVRADLERFIKMLNSERKAPKGNST